MSERCRRFCGCAALGRVPPMESVLSDGDDVRKYADKGYKDSYNRPNHLPSSHCVDGRTCGARPCRQVVWHERYLALRTCPVTVGVRVGHFFTKPWYSGAVITSPFQGSLSSGGRLDLPAANVICDENAALLSVSPWLTVLEVYLPTEPSSATSPLRGSGPAGMPEGRASSAEGRRGSQRTRRFRPGILHPGTARSAALHPHHSTLTTPCGRSVGRRRGPPETTPWASRTRSSYRSAGTFRRRRLPGEGCWKLEAGQSWHSPTSPGLGLEEIVLAVDGRHGADCTPFPAHWSAWSVVAVSLTAGLLLVPLRRGTAD